MKTCNLNNLLMIYLLIFNFLESLQALRIKEENVF